TGIAVAILGAVALWIAPWRGRRRMPLVLGAILLADLWQQHLPINGTAAAADYFPPTPFLRQVQQVVPATERILVVGDSLPTNTALVYGIRDWRAQDPMITTRAFQAAQFLSPQLTSNIWDEYNMFLHDVRLPLAPILGMRYFIFPVGVDPNTVSPSDPQRPPFTRLAYKDGLGLWAAAAVPGFAYLSDGVTATTQPQQIAAWMQGLTWAQVRTFPALVETTPATVAAIHHDPAGTAPGPVTVQEYSPGHIRLQAVAARPALLVVAESWYPGWRGTLDGRPVEILRANYLSQGVVVPAGTHTIVLEYAPDSVRAGALISSMGGLGMLLLAIWAWYRRG
ncbi:MAG TPA: hypothetical protein VKY74_17995, partial [Chloroflexia bacterium]|nr:hypothetical protein [Chloroflexia bacterium]